MHFSSLFKGALVSTLVLSPMLGLMPAQAEMNKPNKSSTETTKIKTSQQAQTSILDIAKSNENFSTLVAAIQAAGLEEVLASNGQFTVFAPTNEAFAKLPQGQLEELLKPENKAQLVSLLTYHVVPSAIASTAIQPGTITTVEGRSLQLSIADSKLKVNDATVLATDIQASNGVIHVVDSVIIPMAQ
ncbi:fasciclin domain-containing protein [Synechococcus elongatus]|uniref:Beta-Ig-H3/fasciclin n=1 Tax=Synechococcus elongatus (strain ATCC 33912 / PCC 7942 / FACHB-805) TaxID=1140 RepID=Q31MT3_SYNE7|nr:Beta-Ig-H3/fasciclin [Synechococcus elongatus PCC 7942 = FACHB-805]AJD57977.1 fasciclin [Synechococcus elongatus UTEX 2973]MBD2588444.1 fasciclin domain-containing protein [Synechococcus elongatus FACHB-242]MBD2689393.1 fasciclin domain-containing protein [Synechococcus elongatus FACHB-1061]UOW71426.1 Uncaracterized surface protein containing fasciclin FAS1 repeats [Synechococcus elongatus PCC 7943]UOW74027.1 Uncaracterized surface protein containing fasciclin FAS1 repeats [Synechococcus el